jgi:hypothetical protein
MSAISSLPETKPAQQFIRSSFPKSNFKSIGRFGCGYAALSSSVAKLLLLCVPASPRFNRTGQGKPGLVLHPRGRPVGVSLMTGISAAVAAAVPDFTRSHSSFTPGMLSAFRSNHSGIGPRFTRSVAMTGLDSRQKLYSEWSHELPPFPRPQASVETSLLLVNAN